MKFFVPFLVCLMAGIAPLSAQAIKFNPNKWDNTVAPPGINTYHFAMDAPLRCKSARVEIDVYREGEKVRTIESGSITLSGEPEALDLKASLLFRHEEGKAGSGYIAIDWSHRTDLSSFRFEESEFPFTKSAANGRFAPSKIEQGRIPVFYLMSKPLSPEARQEGTGFRFAETPEKVLEDNPKMIVLITYLVVD